MISKTCGYGIRGVVYLATKIGEDRKVGIHEIATELEIPQHFLAKILQDLVRKKVICSVKGPNGGFYVRESVLDMPVLEIVEMIDGDGYKTRCFMAIEECSAENPCPLHNDFSVFRSGIAKMLKQKTVGDLSKGVFDGHSFLSYRLN